MEHTMTLNLRTSGASLVLLAGLTAATVPAFAQSDAALVGTYLPKVSNGGLAKLVLSDKDGVLQVHGYGSCSPSFCDWGTVGGVIYSSSVSSANGNTFTASFNFGFATEILTGTLNTSGRLMTINEYTAFAPGDGRNNYHLSNVLVK
jgi:hypothetical protein